MSHLRLVESIPATHAKPGSSRPYKTLYYDTARGTGGWVGHGAAASEKGAIRAAVVRIFEEQYHRAEVYEEGVLIYTLRRTPHGIDINYGAS